MKQISIQNYKIIEKAICADFLSCQLQKFSLILSEFSE